MGKISLPMGSQMSEWNCTNPGAVRVQAHHQNIHAVNMLSNWAAKQIFTHVHSNNLVYNTCWEDPRIDRNVMALNHTADLVMITSAGCNALDYALDAPRSIHAVDVNFRQNALLELKIAAIRHLDYQDFFSLFGEGGHPSFHDWYRDMLRAELSESSQNYWDSRGSFFSRNTPQDSFYHRGTTGVFGRLLALYCRLNGILDTAIRMFELGSLDEQRELYFKVVRDRFWRNGVKRALGTSLAMSLIGVPLAQRTHLEKTCAQGVADFMEDCMEAVFTRIPLVDNYFWRLYLAGRYSKECCPEYLKPSNFERLKGGLVDCIQTHTCDLTAFLQAHGGSFSHFVLLDHMDWLSTQGNNLLQKEWQASLHRARTGAMFLWRSGGSVVDFVDPISVEFGGRTRKVGDLLTYDMATANRLHPLDRVHTYGSFHIAKLAS
jgi:S-adenosylmethionine-diacylglycerol 3-amino-3-carboxypropyl transferase